MAHIQDTLRVDARTCSRGDAIAFAEGPYTVLVAGPGALGGMATAIGYRCSGCERRFRVLPRWLIVANALAVVLLVALVILTDPPDLLGLAIPLAPLVVAMLFVIAYGVLIPRRNPPVSKETAEVLAQAFADPRTASALRGERNIEDLR